MKTADLCAATCPRPMSKINLSKTVSLDPPPKPSLLVSPITPRLPAMEIGSRRTGRHSVLPELVALVGAASSKHSLHVCLYQKIGSEVTAPFGMSLTPSVFHANKMRTLMLWFCSLIRTAKGQEQRPVAGGHRSSDNRKKTDIKTTQTTKNGTQGSNSKVNKSTKTEPPSQEQKKGWFSR